MQPLAYEQLARLEHAHWWFRARRAVCATLLREHLGAARPARILDVGAGVGGFLDELAPLGGTLVHAEIAPELVAAARARGHALGTLARGEALPFADASFELVCMLDVLEHIEDDERALAEARRVLAPGGILFLHVPAHGWLYAANDRASGHHRRYGRASLRARLERAGLAVERATYTNALLFPLIAPLVLGLRCLERLGLARGAEYTNLSWSDPPLLGRALERAFASETALSRRVDLPIGHSLAAIARAPRRSGAAAARGYRAEPAAGAGSSRGASTEPR